MKMSESKTVREFLTEYNNSKGWGVDDGDLAETLTEAERVHAGSTDEHRWYIEQEVVSNVDGTFISFTDYIITGDNNMQDMGLSYDLDSARIVTRKERQIIEVYYE